MTNIILVDDHLIFAEGIAQLILGNPKFRFLGYYSDTDSTMEAFEKIPNIDLVLLDVSVPTMNGIDFCKWIKKTYPKTKVLFFTMHFDELIINRAIRAGGDGYITKNINSAELFTAIEKISMGEVFYSSSIEEVLHKRYNPAKIRDLPILSPREREILFYIVEGLTSYDIGEKLFISTKTVEFHRSNLLVKLDAKNVADLTREAIRIGLVTI